MGKESDTSSAKVSSQAAKSGAPPEAGAPPKKKICCACPESKRLRDECIAEHGEAACGKWIDVHLRCLREEGFNV